MKSRLTLYFINKSLTDNKTLYFINKSLTDNKTLLIHKPEKYPGRDYKEINEVLGSKLKHLHKPYPWE